MKEFIVCPALGAAFRIEKGLKIFAAPLYKDLTIDYQWVEVDPVRVRKEATSSEWKSFYRCYQELVGEL